MRLIVKVAITLIICFAVVVAAKHFWRGKLMGSNEIKSRWGQTEFSSEKFKTGTKRDRANMAYSLVQNQKKFIGRDRAEIRKELGDYDGFYFTDMFPTYIISFEEKKNETWQIVFFLDNDERVSEIAVHKNCCD